MAHGPNTVNAADRDIITPKAPPEQPDQPSPLERPDDQPLEMPDRPGGDDEIEPGTAPDELPE